MIGSFLVFVLALDDWNLINPTWLVPPKSWDQEQSTDANHLMDMLSFVNYIMPWCEPFLFHLTSFCIILTVFLDILHVYSNFWYIDPYSVTHSKKGVNSAEILGILSASPWLILKGLWIYSSHGNQMPVRSHTSSYVILSLPLPYL